MSELDELKHTIELREGVIRILEKDCTEYRKAMEKIKSVCNLALKDDCEVFFDGYLLAVIEKIYDIANGEKE